MGSENYDVLPDSLVARPISAKTTAKKIMEGISIFLSISIHLLFTLFGIWLSFLSTPTKDRKSR